MKHFLSFSIGLLAAAFNAQLVLGTSYNFVFSKSAFSTVGGMAGHDGGLTILDSAGNSIFDMANPDNASPCATETSVFHVTSTCWSQTVELKCTAHSSLVPSSCSALIDGTTYQGDVDNSDDFIGIAISTSGYCGASFEVDDTCGDDSGDITVDYTGTYY